MSWLLKIKHWQLFMLLVVIPYTLSMVGVICMIDFSELESGEFINFNALRFGNFVLLAVIIFFTAVYFAWVYTAGKCVHSRLPDIIKMNFKRFRLFLLYAAVYTFIFCIGFLFVGNLFYAGPYMAFLFPLVIFPLHAFVIFCMLYGCYFIGKALRSKELGREATTGEYIGYFFMLWFLPVGLWFIQPKLNKICGSSQPAGGAYPDNNEPNIEP